MLVTTGSITNLSDNFGSRGKREDVRHGYDAA
jgi:hypothetical protein